MAQMLTQVYTIYYIFTGTLWVSQKHIYKTKKNTVSNADAVSEEEYAETGFPPAPKP